MTTLSYSFARQNLKNIFDMATEKLEEVFISRRNGKNVVVMSEEEFLGWKETLYLMQNPYNALHINDSLQEIKTGKIKSLNLSEL